MRADLSPAFLAELEQRGAAPFQVAVFKFSSGDRYLSDRKFEYAPGEYTESLIESWGTLNRTSSTSETLAGSGVPVSVQKLTILNFGPDWFSSQFNTESSEGIEVEIWQHIKGILDNYLIDSFIIQDNFSHSQASLTVSIDLVSKVMASDPYVGTLNPISNEYYGVTIGSISGVAGTLYGVNPYAKLTVPLTAGASTIICDRDLLSVGFSSSGGDLEIGFDVVSYGSVAGDTFTGVSGVSDDASSGQFVTKKDHDYIFAFGTGPVSLAGPVYINGNIYTGSHVIDNNSDPVTVTFPDRLPYIDTVINPVYLDHEELKELDYSNMDLVNPSHWEPVAFADQGLIADDDYIDGVEIANLPNMDITIPVDAVQVSGSISIRFMKSGWCRANFSLAGTSWSLGDSYTWTTYSRNIYNSADVAGNYFKILSRNTKDGYFLFSPTDAQVFYRIEASWKTLVSAGSTSRESFDNPLLNIGDPASAGANPADVIASIVARNSLLTMNQTALDAARVFYTANGYEFNGFIPGNQRIRKTLHDMCTQCRSILISRAGQLYLHVKQPIAISSPVQTFHSETSNDVLRNSISVSTQRASDLLNSIDVRYDAADVQAGYQESFTVEDTASISQHGRQQDTLDMYLVTDQVMAQDIAAFALEDRKELYTIVTFKGHLPAFPLEIGDVIALRMRYSKLVYFKGMVLDTGRHYGSWKRKQIDYHEIVIAGYPALVKNIFLADDTVFITDDISVVEAIGFGTGGFGEGGYGE